MFQNVEKNSPFFIFMERPYSNVG